MSERALPHDPYVTAVVDALTAAGLEPTSAETRDTEENRFEPDSGTELDALLVWDGDAAGLNTDLHEDGIALLWEHPAEQWQWAPRKRHGELEHEPEFLPTLGRYADPAAVTAAVRALLQGETPPEVYPADWSGADAVRAAVTAWENTDPYAASPDRGDESACNCGGAWHAAKQHCVDWPCPGCDRICPPEPGVPVDDDEPDIAQFGARQE
ncbi:hypothetical protein [Streptomyces phaeochromogenes]|uniref:hypothetical protein n=1 Tax=Streptomyces phaeochromogenes TaxID=1923 RepID=UPI002DD7CF20|nr:hypothetical protein [Streptomyces phaeochromogenes]WRZ30225.1 hypothetical protein OG931_21970 [Streptomyces phaeochromogenes]